MPAVRNVLVGTTCLCAFGLTSIAIAETERAIDVRNLSIFNLDAQTTPSNSALIRLRQVDGVLIHGSRPRGMAGPLLRIEGDESANIRLVGNDLTRLKRVADIGDAVPPGALFFPSGPDERK